MKRRILCFILAFILAASGSALPVLAAAPDDFSQDELLAAEYFRTLEAKPKDRSIALAGQGVTLSEMRARAEAIVNYTWTPSRDISTWAGTPYNGKSYFPAGQQVKGMPYTLFSYELGVMSLCSLDRYKTLTSSNYSATRYCNAVGATRTGPVYGSCCADLVCEVFGGSFMQGNEPLYHGVYGVRDSQYASTSYYVSASKIRSGDALINTRNSHIIWVGEVTDTTITIYEQTPPVAVKVVVDKAKSTNSSGYFVYHGSVYNTVTRSKELVADPPAHTCSSNRTYAVTTNPTPSSYGALTGTCRICGSTTKITMPTLGPIDYVRQTTVAPTCSAEGTESYTWRQTAYGTYVFTRPLATLDHTWDRGVVLRVAQAGVTGSVRYTCTVCGKTSTVSTPASDTCGFSGNCPSARFTDLGAAHRWAHRAVDYAVSNNLFQGNSATAFSPDETMSRAMLVTVLWRSEGSPTGYANPFTDVPSNTWYTQAVAWAAGEGIVNGVGYNRFDPDGLLEWEQITTILYRFAKGEGLDVSAQASLSGYPDGNKVSSWAKPGMQWAVAEGIFAGDSLTDGSRINPRGGPSRAQVAAVLMRFLERY